MAELSKEEIDERVAILKRYKKLLEQQRSKFQEYLKVLENQQNSIVSENPENLFEHTVLEEQIIKNIESLQKVIVPMNELYRQTTAASGKQDSVISALKTDLSSLQKKVLAQNSKNQQILRTHLSQIRMQLNNFRNPYSFNHSGYAQKENVASLVEIQA